MTSLSKYEKDSEYRKKIIAGSCRWQKEHRLHINEQTKKRYANRTPEQIEKRKIYLKELRSNH